MGAGRWDVFPKGCWGIRCGSLSQPNTREGCPILGLGGSSESTCHPVLSGRCTNQDVKSGREAQESELLDVGEAEMVRTGGRETLLPWLS